jgi:hypothetical protein
MVIMAIRRFYRSTAVVAVWFILFATGAKAEQLLDIPPDTVPGSQPQIMNGTAVPGTDWPATFISRTDTPAGSFRCTATIIGPHAVLTAAHCVDNGATMSVRTTSGTISAVCTHHPGYRPTENYRDDIALCLLNATATLLTGARYERLNSNPSYLGVGRAVRLVGYGCTSAGGAASPYLFAGPASLQSIYDNRLGLGGTGAVLCEGDSGGAAYSEGPGPARVVIGVNSTRGYDYSASTLTDIAAPEVAAFITSWAGGNGAAICGYDAPTATCHP